MRAKIGLSQPQFAKAFGISVATLRDWEQRRHAPRGAALTLLRVIDREPDAVKRALTPKVRRRNHEAQFVE